MRTPEDMQPAGGELLRFGTIAQVDLGEGKCTVTVGDLTSGPVRWFEHRAGDTRSWSPPSVGEQVMLICPEGEIEAGIAFRGVFSSAFAPPGDSLRELLQFKDGAVLAYDPEGHVLDALLPDGATLNIVATGGVTIDASGGGVAIVGDVTVEGTVTASDDVVADGVSLKSHVHGGVQAGGEETGEPS